MSKDEALKGIKSVLEEISDGLDGKKQEVTLQTRPIGDLIGFDSMMGVVATISCFEKFNLKVDLPSIFVGKDTNNNPCALTVEQVADRLVEISQKN
jgi:hypothetical protein